MRTAQISSTFLRNPFLSGLLALSFSFALAQTAHAQNAETTEAPDTRTWHHALSLVDTPQYPADFKHFKWANPDASKGGTVTMQGLGSFDSLNAFSFKGDRATGLALISDTLMASSLDEPSTEYGLVADAVSYPDDFSSATFRLRPQARFHDGKPITPEDVIFSLEMLKKAHPFYNAYYKNVTSAEKTAENEVTFRFDTRGNRELPHIMGQLAVLPKHYWTANDASGKPRDLTKTTLKIPLSSGPYKITDVKPGRSITYTRVEDYWAKDLPVSIGQWNFGTITYDYYRDSTVAFEAFRAGKVDYRAENSSKNWSSAYDFKAVKKGWIKKDQITLKNLAPMQGFLFNIRRKKFADPRVRRAFNLAFDFEWSNKNLFSGLYKRVGSYFENSELASAALPKGLELEILETVRADVPPSVFTEVFTNPVNNSPGDLRQNLKKANDLLAEAGWSAANIAIDDPDCGFFCGIMQSVGLKSKKTRRALRNKDGEEMKVEILLISPQFQRVVLPYASNLAKLGITATPRLVESAQYVRSLQTFEFDMVVGSFPQSESPGNEQRDFWGTKNADRKGSRNLIGIKNPAVEKLIDRIIYAKSRMELVAATNALDRVLLHNHYLVPQWYNPDDWIAYWDKFGRPDTQASRAIGFLQTWWVDKDAAAKLAAARQ